MDNETKRPTVLIVDDDQSMRMLIAAIVTKLGCDVCAKGEDGNEGLALFRQHKPDITFLDLNMPDISGIDVLKAIKEMDKQSYVCIISGEGSGEQVRLALDNGVSGFVVKPINVERLESVVNKYLQLQ